MTSVLLDANVAIKSAELGAFESILKLRHIKIHIVPQVRDQIKYYSKKDRDVKFDLPKYLNSGRIQLIDCYGEDIMAIMNLLPDKINLGSRARTKPKVDQAYNNKKLTEALPKISFTSLEEGIKNVFSAERKSGK